MKENSKKSLIILVITIALFVVAIIGATYAYFATTTRIDANIGVNVETAGASYTFTATSDSQEINMSITAVDMAEANVSTEKIKNGIGNIDVSLSSPTNDVATVCTYDIIWVWDSSDIYEEPETEIGVLPYFNDGVLYSYEFSTKIDNANETDLSKLDAGTTPNSIILQRGASIVSHSTTATEKKHVIEASIYNLPVDQEKLKGKSFNAHITIENVECTMTDGKLLSAYVINDVYKSDANQASITAETKGAGLYKHDASLVNGAKDGAYRYSGADESVNNYICFENDDCSNEDNLFRIISVDNNGITKIIKATSLGDKPWNNKPAYQVKGTAEEAAQNLTSSSYTNIWAIKKDGEWYTSSLNDYLNDDYLPTMEAKTDKIVTTTWSVAGFTGSDQTSKNVFEIYEIETSNKAIYPTKVGLMYAYEYMYAALPSHWHKIGHNSSTPANGYNSVGNGDWLKTAGNPWILSRYSGYNVYAFYVNSDGGHIGNHYASNGRAVRPVLSLSPSAKLLNATAEGVGSKSNPMIIEAKKNS